MKTQITKTLQRDTDTENYIDDDNRRALCFSFVRVFFPNQPLPAKVKVSVSIRSWAFKGARRIWIRHQCLDMASPSSWTWAKDGILPSHFSGGGGMYEMAMKQVTILMGDKLATLPIYLSGEEQRNGHAIPLYVRMVKDQLPLPKGRSL